VLPGVQECFQLGSLSSLHLENRRVAKSMAMHIDATDAVSRNLAEVLFDPQTSGGLVASIPAARAESCLAALHEAGYLQSAIIGRVLDASESPIKLLP